MTSHFTLRTSDFGFPTSHFRLLTSHFAKGFTLIELALVAATLGILLVSAVPRIQRSWSGFHTERVTFQVAQTLRAARTLAIVNHRALDWIWDDEGRSVCIGSPQATGCAATDVTDRLARARPVPPPIRLTIEQDGRFVERVRFFPDGTSQSTTIRVHDATTLRSTITVDGPTSQVAVLPARLSTSR